MKIRVGDVVMVGGDAGILNCQKNDGIFRTVLSIHAPTIFSTRDGKSP